MAYGCTRRLSLWSALFNADRRYEPNPERTAEWNRGAYLVEALGHCGECHTPRNAFFALDQRRKFAGGIEAGWRAYNITPDRRSGIGAWSDADLFDYLAEGHAAGHGTASGPMGEAVDMSTRYLRGAKRASSDPTRNMPAFGDTYTNDEVASIANFVIARYGAQASELTAERVAQLRRED